MKAKDYEWTHNYILLCRSVLSANRATHFRLSTLKIRSVKTQPPYVLYSEIKTPRDKNSLRKTVTKTAEARIADTVSHRSLTESKQEQRAAHLFGLCSFTMSFAISVMYASQSMTCTG